MKFGPALCFTAISATTGMGSGLLLYFGAWQTAVGMLWALLWVSIGMIAVGLGWALSKYLDSRNAKAAL